MMFPDFFDLFFLIGPVYTLIVDFDRSARDDNWSWPEVDDLQMALLMGGPLDNMAAR